MNTLKKIAAATAVALASSAANASLLDIVNLDADAYDVSPYVIPSNNNMAGFVGTSGEIGSQVLFGASTQIELTFELLFSEAGYQNAFSYGGDELFQTVRYHSRDYTTGALYTAPVSIVVDATEGGLLDFAFSTLIPTTLDSVTNANNGESAIRSIFTSLSGNVLYLAFDDSGAGPDDNHDDMIIRVTARDVSEPATLALMGLGLAGLGLARRKTKKA